MKIIFGSKWAKCSLTTCADERSHPLPKSENCFTVHIFVLLYARSLAVFFMVGNMPCCVRSSGRKSGQTRSAFVRNIN